MSLRARGKSFSHHVSLDDGAGECGPAFSNFSTRVDGCVDSSLDAVSDDGSEFVAAGVDEFSFDEAAMVAAVMAAIGEDSSSSDVDV